MSEITATCDPTDPAQLAAWYGNFGFLDHYRKVTLAHCRELIRAEFTLRAEKVTETRLDDLSRIHDGYLDFLTMHLNGRTEYEKMVRQTLGMR